MFAYQIPRDTPMIAKSDPTIAPVAPAASSITPLPSKRPAWLLQAVGTLDPAKVMYPGVLFTPGTGTTATGSPILPNTGHAVHRFTFTPGLDMVANGWVYETDVKYILVCADGLKRVANCSLQRKVLTGEIDIDSGATPDWHPEPLLMGGLVANRKHYVRIEHTWDLVNNVYSVLSYRCVCQDRIQLELNPASMMNVPMAPTNWASTGIGTAYDQQQLGLMPAGGAVSLIVEDIEHRYW
jgi:hypothetical protein